MINAPKDSGEVAAGDAANYIFPGWVTRCVVSNLDDNYILYRVHPIPGSNECSATVYDGIIPAKDSVEISLDGARSILGVSIFCPTDHPGTDALVNVQGMPV
jgi:hypothetical protein